MLGKAQHGQINDRIRHLLFKRNYVEATSGGNYSLTEQGFRFIWLDVGTQVHQLLLDYLRTCADRGTNEVSVMRLIFNFSLSSYEQGLKIEDKDLMNEFIDIIKDLNEFGLLYVRKLKRIYITPLMKSFLEGSSYNEDETKNNKFLVVETNFRVYAYTASELYSSILGKADLMTFL